MTSTPPTTSPYTPTASKPATNSSFTSSANTRKDSPAPRIQDTQDLNLLDRVYGDPKAIDRLSAWPQYSARDVCDWMDGHIDPRRTKELAAALHAAAISALNQIKARHPALVRNPGDIHIGHATHTIYNDAGSQNTVNLMALRNLAAYRPTAAVLKSILRTSGYDCSVDLIRLYPSAP